jgi:hypothetical protein
MRQTIGQNQVTFGTGEDKITLEQNRTEQLRKLGRLLLLPRPVKPIGVYIRRKHGCETALQSEPRKEGSLLPGCRVPGNCSAHAGWCRAYALLNCTLVMPLPFRSSAPTAMCHVPCHGAEAACLPCRLNGKDPVLLLFAICCCQLVKVAFKEEPVVLRQPLCPHLQLVHYLLHQFLLVCRHQGAGRPVMDKDAPVDPLEVCHLQKLCYQSQDPFGYRA